MIGTGVGWPKLAKSLSTGSQDMRCDGIYLGFAVTSSGSYGTRLVREPEEHIPYVIYICQDRTGYKGQLKRILPIIRTNCGVNIIIIMAASRCTETMTRATIRRCGTANDPCTP